MTSAEAISKFYKELNEGGVPTGLVDAIVLRFAQSLFDQGNVSVHHMPEDPSS